MENPFHTPAIPVCPSPPTTPPLLRASAPRSVRDARFRRARVAAPLDELPVDFLSDPDGPCDYELLAEAAGFDPEAAPLSIGALIAPYRGFPEGSAVVVRRGADPAQAALLVLLEHRPRSLPSLSLSLSQRGARRPVSGACTSRPALRCEAPASTCDPAPLVAGWI